MMKSLRNQDSKASMVSLSTSSSLCASSSNEKVRNSPFGTRRGLCKRSSSSSLNLCALSQLHSSSMNLSSLSEDNGSGQFAYSSTGPYEAEGCSAVGVLLEADKPLFSGLLALVAFFISRYIVFVLDIMRPEIVYSAELLKSAILGYRDNYLEQQREEEEEESGFPTGSLKRRSWYKSCRSSASEESLISGSPSEEFQPKARLINSTGEEEEKDGWSMGDDATDQWGHFADFDNNIEEKDVVFTVPQHAHLSMGSKSKKLDTLAEDEERDEEEECEDF